MGCHDKNEKKSSTSGTALDCRSAYHFHTRAATRNPLIPARRSQFTMVKSEQAIIFSSYHLITDTVAH